MSLLAVDFKFPRWLEKIESSKDEIARYIAAQMQFNRGMLFDNEGAYNGHKKWAPLKLRSGMILSLTGTLRKSMGPKNNAGRPGSDGIVRFSGDTITIGTRLGYARMMNDGTEKLPGGVLRPVRAKALAIPLPSGQKIKEEAKGLRKEASTKADFAKKIAKLETRIRKEKDPVKRDALNSKFDRWKKNYLDSPKDQKVIFRKSVKIPARPFDTWTKEDGEELDIALANKLMEILSK